jgi:hypothetical protein
MSSYWMTWNKRWSSNADIVDELLRLWIFSQYLLCEGVYH